VGAKPTDSDCNGRAALAPTRYREVVLTVSKHGYSYRSATSGSTFVALRAGT
jgi:hypothetical protein